jgi:hypothetical protein
VPVSGQPGSTTPAARRRSRPTLVEHGADLIVSDPEDKEPFVGIE